ncbi:RcpC/CpaB family pilus assembly protein [Streptomyces sp. XM4193]|uniref:RcpC/CpaB family pilus assembly protein n=1 Tax=Streptomyces sp. XM4193 TaxID=2929782 RepID=UPI001FFAF425|nr:RcpC/CpaB family pilus assembly protein [Streptomyces sp. XM4193]MCK1796793.1 RcpC/CpaB family pilus assembly protein [Streptomyces sp. XM4193]
MISGTEGPAGLLSRFRPLSRLAPSRRSTAAGLLGALIALALLLPQWGRSAEAPGPATAARQEAAAPESESSVGGGPGPASAGSTGEDRTGASSGSGRHEGASGRLVSAPVRLADAEVVGLLRRGDRVDVLASRAEGSPGGQARVVAHRVRVAQLPTPAGGGDASGAAGPQKEDGGLVVLAVPPATAKTLAGAAAHSRLTVSLW